MAGEDTLVKELKEIRAGIDAKMAETAEAVKKQREEVEAQGKSSAETVAKLRELGDQNVKFQAQLLDIEQRMAADLGNNTPQEEKSWGETLADSDELKDYVKRGARGTMKVEVKQRDPFGQKTILNLGATANLVAPMRLPDILRQPMRQLRIRDLLAPGRTTSNAIQYVRQTSRTNAAAAVAENTSKPQSDLALDVVSTPVSTIATWMKASRQALDDLQQLQSLVDGELRYMLAFVEETQMLTGDGTGVNLSGLITLATAYDTTRSVTGEQRLDIISHAIEQTTESLFPATGVVLHPRDWERIRLTKATTGEYLLGEGAPFDQQITPRIWGLPVVTSLSMTAGTFLVGSFQIAAQIFDRMDAEVLVSTEDQDNFVKNMVTVRAEERLAMAVYRPLGLVYGTMPTIPVP